MPERSSAFLLPFDSPTSLRNRWTPNAAPMDVFKAGIYINAMFEVRQRTLIAPFSFIDKDKV